MNLFFRVLRKRPDGYHDVASLYQAIDLADRLFFFKASKDELSCSNPSIPLSEENLVFRALKLFRSCYPIPPFKIHIEKKIPIQAGLGGGSSNAATTLWALNEITGKRASLEQLMDMGAKIGSDVPFFFSRGSAYCTGRGEMIEEVSYRPLRGFLAKPDFGLSTPLVYRHVDLKALPKRDLRKALQEFIFFNDLEFSSFRLEPRLQILKELLELQFKSVTMTGSGTAFFCLDGSPCPIKDVAFSPFQSQIREAGIWY